MFNIATALVTTGFAMMFGGSVMDVLVATAMGFWLVGSEIVWQLLARNESIRHRTLCFWIGKYVLFNLIYIPTLIWGTQLFMAKKVEGMFFMVLLLAGQVALWIYDRAHLYMQIYIWGKFRKKLMGNY